MQGFASHVTTDELSAMTTWRRCLGGIVLLLSLLVLVMVIQGCGGGRSGSGSGHKEVIIVGAVLRPMKKLMAHAMTHCHHGTRGVDGRVCNLLELEGMLVFVWDILPSKQRAKQRHRGNNLGGDCHWFWEASSSLNELEEWKFSLIYWICLKVK